MDAPMMEAMPPAAMGGMGPMHMEQCPPEAMAGMAAAMMAEAVAQQRTLEELRKRRR